MARSSAGRSQMPHLTALKFRDENSPNVDDSGWVPLERVTALVGRNESGKTATLKALHKFNPADRDPFIAQFEFPRCRYVRDFKGNPKKPWPVVSVTFQIGTALRARLAILLERGHPPPDAVTITRYYPADHTKAPYASRYAFQPAVTSPDPPVQRLLAALGKVEGEGPGELWSALQAHLFGAASRGEDEHTTALRDQLVPWAMAMREAVETLQNTGASLRDPAGKELVERILKDGPERLTPEATAVVGP